MNIIEIKLLSVFWSNSNIVAHDVAHGEKMDLIDFQSRMSKVKVNVITDKYGYNLVNTTIKNIWPFHR